MVLVYCPAKCFITFSNIHDTLQRDFLNITQAINILSWKKSYSPEVKGAIIPHSRPILLPRGSNTADHSVLPDFLCSPPLRLMLKHTVLFVYILHVKWDSTLDFRGPGRRFPSRRKSPKELGPCSPVFSSCPQTLLGKGSLWSRSVSRLLWGSFVKSSIERCYMKCKDYF